MSWIFFLYLWWTCLLWCVFIRAKKKGFFLRFCLWISILYILKKKNSIVLILGYVFLKHNILFYNLDQNVFTVDMKTYFYKILKMISIYVLEMIFYNNSWQYSYNCPHSSCWASGVYKSYFPWNMPHSQVEAYRYVHSELIRFFILIIDNILWGPIPGLITCTCT